ncbi:hypothetical protein HDE_07562 [Halotydeus destructor]|nr:hypothetical protein HDE_07562 [Halotydeus destructor]
MKVPLIYVRRKPWKPNRLVVYRNQLAISPTSCLWPCDKYYLSPRRVSQTSPLPHFEFKTRFSYRKFKKGDNPFHEPDSPDTRPSTSFTASSLASPCSVRSVHDNDGLVEAALRLDKLRLSPSPLMTPVEFDDFAEAFDSLTTAEVTVVKDGAGQVEKGGPGQSTPIGGKDKPGGRSGMPSLNLSPIREEEEMQIGTAVPTRQSDICGPSLGSPVETTGSSSCSSSSPSLSRLSICSTARKAHKLPRNRIRLRNRNVQQQLQEAESAHSSPKATSVSIDSRTSTLPATGCHESLNVPSSPESWSSHCCTTLHTTGKRSRTELIRITIKKTKSLSQTAGVRRESVDTATQTIEMIDQSTQTESND